MGLRINHERDEKRRMEPLKLNPRNSGRPPTARRAGEMTGR